MDISGAISAISTATEITKLLITSKVEEKVKGKALELELTMLSLHALILTLHSQNHELNSKNYELSELKNKLQNELKKIKDFNKDAKRFELHQLCAGVLVYKLKESHANGEPPHYICPYCFRKQEKSILQLRDRDFGGAYHHCQMPTCKAEFIDHDDGRSVHL